MSSSTQKAIIKEFQVITGNTITLKKSEELLKSNNFNLQVTIEQYYNNNSSSKVGDKSKLNAIFSRFNESNDKNLLDCTKFFDEIKLDGNGIAGFVLAWKLDSKVIGCVTNEEFTNKFSEHGVDTLPTITIFLTQSVKSLDNVDTFRECYKWIFKYLKGTGIKKTLDKNEMNFILWRMLLPDNKYPLIEPLLKYYESTDGTISLDLWTMTFEFVRSINSDFGNYDGISGAWPTAIDTFVELQKAKK